MCTSNEEQPFERKTDKTKFRMSVPFSLSPVYSFGFCARVSVSAKYVSRYLLCYPCGRNFVFYDLKNATSCFLTFGFPRSTASRFPFAFHPQGGFMVISGCIRSGDAFEVEIPSKHLPLSLAFFFYRLFSSI